MDDSFVIPANVLDDLCSRFIINVPEEERNDLIRIFFQIEIAHWFYLDFFCSEKPELRSCGIRNFAENIFRHCSFLIQHSNQVDDILSKWKTFKHAVPTNGAIILDESMRYVLLVQGFWAKASWGFPKGKVIEDETEMNCAIREVLEETGYDLSAKVEPDQYLQISINEQVIRLYIVRNVPRSTQFEPRTRREIKEVRWFAIDELPVHKKDVRTKQTLGYSPNAFFMVIPFVKSLKQWIATQGSHAPKTTLPHSMSVNSGLSSVANSSKDEMRRQKQAQYYNKLNKEGYDELMKCKEGFVSAKFQKTSPTNLIGSYGNSRFKPVSNGKGCKTSTSTPAALSTANIIPTTRKHYQHQYHHQHQHNSQQQNSQAVQLPQQPQQQVQLAAKPTIQVSKEHQTFNNKAKKHLEFYGPECWVNFKFNYDEILRSLPQTFSMT